MTIEIWVPADELVNSPFPEAVASIDREMSYENFERMLEAELRRIYPDAAIAVRVAALRGMTILLDHMDVTSNNEPEATNLSTSVRYAMDKLFFYGRFWEDKRPLGGL